jgi:RHS repeat-associated protein
VDARQFSYNLRFPGQYYDAETGLNQNYFRDYDPAIGRYVESDPIGLKAGINTYAYALDQPTNYIDPNGLDAASTIQCDGKGGYEVVNTNTQCDKSCTQAHEQSHIRDWIQRYVPTRVRTSGRVIYPSAGRTITSSFGSLSAVHTAPERRAA